MDAQQGSPAPLKAAGPRNCQLGGDRPEDNPSTDHRQRPARALLSMRWVADHRGRFICLEVAG